MALKEGKKGSLSLTLSKMPWSARSVSLPRFLRRNLVFVSSSFEEDMNRQSATLVPPVSIWFALAALALSPASGSAQSPTEQLQFDAAPVKVNESADRPSTRYDPVRIDLRKASIKHLIRRAWPLPDYQIVWPAWVNAQARRAWIRCLGHLPSRFEPGASESHVSGSARDSFRTGDALGIS